MLLNWLCACPASLRKVGKVYFFGDESRCWICLTLFFWAKDCIILWSVGLFSLDFIKMWPFSLTACFFSTLYWVKKEGNWADLLSCYFAGVSPDGWAILPKSYGDLAGLVGLSWPLDWIMFGSVVDWQVLIIDCVELFIGKAYKVSLKCFWIFWNYLNSKLNWQLTKKLAWPSKILSLLFKSFEFKLFFQLIYLNLNLFYFFYSLSNNLIL